MVPTSFECPTRHAGSVRVTIDGGKKTNPMLATQISHEDFVQATGEAISRSGLFQSVAQGNDETYLLAVKLEDRNGLQNSDRQLIKRSGVRSIDT